MSPRFSPAPSFHGQIGLAVHLAQSMRVADGAHLVGMAVLPFTASSTDRGPWILCTTALVGHSARLFTTCASPAGHLCGFAGRHRRRHGQHDSASESVQGQRVPTQVLPQQGLGKRLDVAALRIRQRRTGRGNILMKFNEAAGDSLVDISLVGGESGEQGAHQPAWRAPDGLLPHACVCVQGTPAGHPPAWWCSPRRARGDCRVKLLSVPTIAVRACAGKGIHTVRHSTSNVPLSIIGYSRW